MSYVFCGCPVCNKMTLCTCLLPELLRFLVFLKVSIRFGDAIKHQLKLVSVKLNFELDSGAFATENRVSKFAAVKEFASTDGQTD